MPIHPGMVEPLAERTRDLYADAEERLLGIIARQLAAGLEAPGWAVAKLGAVQALRRAGQDVVDQLASAVELEVFDVVAEAYNVGHRSAIAELGALPDGARRLVDEATPNAQAVDRLAHEAVETVTATHRGILRAMVDGFRAVVAEVTATPLLGIGTRRQATQDAMRRFADRGIRSFVDRAGRAWSLTSYAEMAVRTSVARAATEAHMRTLSDAGIDLVIVSDAPLNCPLCRPWEGRILTIGGEDGARTVQVEHAIEDDRMVPVRVAGSLDEARRAGLQHPNCRHSVSAYTPGITRAETAAPDPDGYQAGQRQREIERHIRRWKRRETAAVGPEQKRAAAARVRQWQRAIREHLAAHPDLRRLRTREQPGAGNLPGKQTAPPAEAVQAARVRAGDRLTPGEMTDEQLADAVRSGALDERELQRVAAETDRRDLAALLDRVRPGGTLADDLAGFSDDDLARALPHLDDEQTLRVAAEMDRRDVAARMPGADADLVGLSDDDLARRARGADGDTLTAIAAEAHRRDLLAMLFPGGDLVADLSDVGDDDLSWAMQYATAVQLARISAEIDRRYPVNMPTLDRTGDAVADLLGDRTTVDEALDSNADDWSHLHTDRFEGMTATERWIAEREHDQEAARTAYTRAQIREMYRGYVYRQWLTAEDDTRGVLLSRRAEADGINPRELFSGPAHIAYARASEELKEWWQANGRLTLAEFTEQVTGVRTAEAETARQSAQTQQGKL